MSKESNKNAVWSFLKEKGLSDAAAAGVMGNIEQESNFSTTAENSNSGAYGLFQWTGGRKTALQDYAKETGGKASDLETQLEFFWQEINGSEKKTKTALFSSDYSSPEEYAAAFEKTFERSGGSAMSARKSNAANIYAAYTDTDYSATSESESGAANSYGLKWWGDIVKVVVIILIAVGGVVLLASAFNFSIESPIDAVKKKVVKGGGTDGE